MEAYPRRSKLGKFMLVGGLVGAAVSLLFDRETRMTMMKGMGATKNGGVKLYQNMKNNPSRIPSYIREKADYIKMTAQEISKDLTEMADKMHGVTTSSKQAYQYAMETGGEISKITHKLRHPMQAKGLSSGAGDVTKAATTQSKPRGKQISTAATSATTTDSNSFGKKFGNEGTFEHFPSNSSNK